MNTKTKKVAESEKSFDDSMHLYGRITTVIMLIVMLASPFVISLYFKEAPNWAAMLSGAVTICIVFIPSGIIEVITYAPMLGTGATYLAFITGNLINLKIPCVMNAKEIVGVENGTEENEVVSIISVATSAIVTILIITIGVVLLVPLTPIISAPILKPAFGNVIFALFGALGFQHFAKIPKVAVVPFVLFSVIYFLVPSLATQTGIMVPIAAVFTIVTARIMYKKGLLTKPETIEPNDIEKGEEQ